MIEPSSPCQSTVHHPPSAGWEHLSCKGKIKLLILHTRFWNYRQGIPKYKTRAPWAEFLLTLAVIALSPRNHPRASPAFPYAHLYLADNALDCIHRLPGFRMLANLTCLRAREGFAPVKYHNATAYLQRQQGSAQHRWRQGGSSGVFIDQCVSLGPLFTEGIQVLGL